jgi:hypothetical protein
MGFMMYAVEMGSGAMIYSYIYQTGSGIQKLIEGIHRHTDRQNGSRISLLLQNKESRVKITIA